MKVLLIQPPSLNWLTASVPFFSDDDDGFYPSLGLLYIASHLEKYSSHTVEILDAVVEQITSYDALEERIRKSKPDIVGIQMLTFTARDALLTARTVKKIDKNIPVVVGGPHPNIYVNETIAFDEIDIIVLGEGEKIFTDLVNQLSNGEDISDMPGIALKNKEKVIINDQKGYIEDLDSLPFPARHLTPYKKYYSILGNHATYTTMVSSRGCPFRCLFCDRAYHGKIYRKRSAENVVREMNDCEKMGIQEIDFQDDLFTFKKDRVLEICDLLISEKSKLKWNVRARVDTLDKALIKRMAEAGCQRMYIGIEAGTPEIQKVLRKNIDLDKAKQVFKWARDYGICTLAYLIIGSPQETKDLILESIKYTVKLNPDFTHIGIMTPYPHTDLYSLGLEKALYNDYWREFAKDPFKDFSARHWEEVLSKEELIDLLGRAYRSFYLRPTYIFRELFKVKTRKELFRKIKGGFQVAFHT
jgi:anaerobic magnesium-protoporphyrin IX monomethyl ester cyclase